VQDPATLARQLQELAATIEEATRAANSLPFLGGQIFEGQAFGAAALILRHNLGRAYRGYDLLRVTTVATLYEPTWAPSTAYSSTTPSLVLPTVPRGLFFQCTASGTSGTTEPRWPTVPGGTVTDNGATWTAVAYDPTTQVLLAASSPCTGSVFIF
jgi:hypothetical protein